MRSLALNTCYATATVMDPRGLCWRPELSPSHANEVTTTALSALGIFRLCRRRLNHFATNRLGERTLMANLASVYSRTCTFLYFYALWFNRFYFPSFTKHNKVSLNLQFFSSPRGVPGQEFNAWLTSRCSAPHKKKGNTKQCMHTVGNLTNGCIAVLDF